MALSCQKAPQHREALSASISEDMVYIAASDIESTYGIYQESQVRFPIEEGLLSKSWYVKDILPTLDNRLTPPPNTIPTIDGLIQAARQAGLEVVSTDFQLLERGGGMPQLRGLIYVSHPRIVDNVSEKTVEGALKLCPFMEEMTPLNPGGHAFSHALRRLFARGFQGAAYYLKTSMHKNPNSG